MIILYEQQKTSLILNKNIVIFLFLKETNLVPEEFNTSDNFPSLPQNGHGNNTDLYKLFPWIAKILFHLILNKNELNKS